MVKHSASRKSRKHTARKSHKRSQKRSQTRRRHRGGVAPVEYALSGSWPSQTSLGQGGDYLGYHQEQHGGGPAPYPGSLAGAPLLSPGLEGSSMTTGLTKAMADIAGLSDMPSSSAAMQAGGRRHKRKGTKKRSTKKRSTKRRSTKRRSHRHRGGALVFAPFNPAATSGMLLSSAAQYDAAGLNPGYISGDVEGVAAAARGDTN